MNSHPLQVDPIFRAGSASGRGGYTGRMMGGFCLHDELASGGMASVYLAYKEGPRGIGQMAAVKVIHPHLAHRREYVNMFLDEARISACINHPNVVRVLDFGEEDGSYYLAMEHLTGKTWHDVWRATLDRKDSRELQRLPRLAAWVLSQACEGLHTAHEALDLSGSPLHVVHRDISPQNVFVTFDGNVRVIDFGIASAEKRLHITKEGMIKGRIAYMSPEQMSGAETDRRADVWSMGVLLWEALARQRLFARFDDAATIAAVLNAYVPPIPQSVGKVPQALVDIALKALQRNPEDRFATARQMADALSAFVADHGRVAAADVSAHIQPMFVKDIAEQQRQRADAADAFALLPTRQVAAKISVVRPLPPSDAPKAESKLEPALVALEPSVADLSPTLVTASIDEAALTVRSRAARIAQTVLLGTLTLMLATAAPEVWLVAQNMVRSEQPANLSDSASLMDALPSARATKDLLRLASSEGAERAGMGSGSLSQGEGAASAPGETPSRAWSEQPTLTHKRERVERAENHSREPRAKTGTSKRDSAAKAAPGALNVTTPGCWAVVYADGRKLGMSPGQFSLPPGQHTIELAIQGKNPRQRRSTAVRSGRTERLRVDCP